MGFGIASTRNGRTQRGFSSRPRRRVTRIRPSWRRSTRRSLRATRSRKRPSGGTGSRERLLADFGYVNRTSTVLPTVSVTAIATTPERAATLANDAIDALRVFVQRQQNHTGITVENQASLEDAEHGDPTPGAGVLSEEQDASGDRVRARSRSDHRAGVPAREPAPARAQGGGRSRVDGDVHRRSTRARPGVIERAPGRQEPHRCCGLGPLRRPRVARRDSSFFITRRAASVRPPARSSASRHSWSRTSAGSSRGTRCSRRSSSSVLLIPIRRYNFVSGLPFNLEIYRLLIFVVGALCGWQPSSSIQR